MDRYKKNLKVDGDKVYSYNTHVATIHDGKITPHGYWSPTTSKHINYVARERGLEKTAQEEIKEKKSHMASKMNPEFNALRMVMGIGDILHKDHKSRNAFHKRMMKASLGSRGLDFPEDFDSLPEKERTRRIEGARKYLK